jgi:hypothetical protein
MYINGYIYRWINNTKTNLLLCELSLFATCFYEIKFIIQIIYVIYKTYFFSTSTVDPIPNYAYVLKCTLTVSTLGLGL